MDTQGPRELESISRLCAVFQRPYSAVKRALDESGAMPELVLSGTPYYGERAIEAAAERLQGKPEGKR